MTSRGAFILIAFAAIVAALVYMSYQHKQEAAANTAANAIDTASALAINGQNVEATNIPTGGELPITEIPQADTPMPTQSNALINAAMGAVTGNAA